MTTYTKVGSLPSDVERYLQNWQGEVDGAAQYRAMARAQKSPHLARVYGDLARMEEKHMAFWEVHLEEAGVPIPEHRPGWRARFLIWLTERLGPKAVPGTVAAYERVDRNDYAPQKKTQGMGMVGEEHLHGRVLDEIVRVDEAGVGGAFLAQIEGRHKSVGANALRAAVLGANDGLCSNLSLVMGVAGASFDRHLLLLTGLAGLVAGACSMALGEWLSVTNAKELAERAIRVESDELDLDPAAEGEELQLIYEAKGMKPPDAKALAQQMVSDRGRAIDALTREELGIAPEELGGNAFQAAAVSFALFSVGAIIPVLPLYFVEGMAVAIACALLSATALFAFGALSTIFTGKSVCFAATRQLALGLLAASLTFSVGRLVGASLS